MTPPQADASSLGLGIDAGDVSSLGIGARAGAGDVSGLGPGIDAGDVLCLGLGIGAGDASGLGPGIGDVSSLGSGIRADDVSGLGLGIDAGGSATRWALAAPSGLIVAEGVAPGLSALQMASAAGQQALRAALDALCREALGHGRPCRVRAGLTGFSGDGELLSQWLAEALSLRRAEVVLSNDIEIAYLDNFAPGQGYLVYAGTGSIAAWIDADGVFQRAGGRGVLLDDGGGGYWIAREALRRIWRREDEAPGSWRDSELARAVFAHIGGDDWALSRQFVYGQERGAIGQLALAVAVAADSDPAARAILERAGRELARLALALIGRCGPRPVVLAGRAAELHPVIGAAMRAALPAAIRMEQKATRPHHAAARIAVREAGRQ